MMAAVTIILSCRYGMYHQVDMVRMSALPASRADRVSRLQQRQYQPWINRRMRKSANRMMSTDVNVGLRRAEPPRSDNVRSLRHYIRRLALGIRPGVSMSVSESVLPRVLRFSLLPVAPLQQERGWISRAQGTSQQENSTRKPVRLTTYD